MKTTVNASVTDLEARQQRPVARGDGLLVEELDDETLVYDLRSHEAHCLNRSAALVWRASDGDTPVREMARRLGGVGLPEDEAVVWMALSRLERAGLLEGSVRVPGARRRFSRKEVVRLLGLTASFGVILPAVSSITAPLAAQAASCIPAADCDLLAPPDCGGLPICENRTRCCNPQNKTRCGTRPC